MKMYLPIVFVFMVSICSFPEVLEAGTYSYDRFSGEHIDGEKWSFDSPYGTWNCQEVFKGIVAGQYFSQIRSDSDFARTRLASQVVSFTSCQIDMKLGDPGLIDTGNNTEVEAEFFRSALQCGLGKPIRKYRQRMGFNRASVQFQWS
jgi:hypothetical protein